MEMDYLRRGFGKSRLKMVVRKQQIRNEIKMDWNLTEDREKWKLTWFTYLKRRPVALKITGADFALRKEREDGHKEVDITSTKQLLQGINIWPVMNMFWNKMYLFIYIDLIQ